jgi:hypothetical protein
MILAQALGEYGIAGALRDGLVVLRIRVEDTLRPSRSTTAWSFSRSSCCGSSWGGAPSLTFQFFRAV